MKNCSKEEKAASIIPDDVTGVVDDVYQVYLGLFTKRPASQRGMSFNTHELLPHEASNKMRQLSYIAGSVGSRI